MTPEQPEPLMRRGELQKYGVTYTWQEWVTQCSYLADRWRRFANVAVEQPDPTVVSEPWLTYWRAGINSKQAMERVNNRAL